MKTTQHYHVDLRPNGRIRSFLLGAAIVACFSVAIKSEAASLQRSLDSQTKVIAEAVSIVAARRQQIECKFEIPQIQAALD